MFLARCTAWKIVCISSIFARTVARYQRQHHKKSFDGYIQENCSSLQLLLSMYVNSEAAQRFSQCRICILGAPSMQSSQVRLRGATSRLRVTSRGEMGTTNRGHKLKAHECELYREFSRSQKPEIFNRCPKTFEFLLFSPTIDTMHDENLDNDRHDRTQDHNQSGPVSTRYHRRTR